MSDIMRLFFGCLWLRNKKYFVLKFNFFKYTAIKKIMKNFS